MEDIRKRFLTNTDETGRFIVKSLKTGICYYVEPIGSGRNSGWGDYDPVTKKFTGSYGIKHTGSVTSEESLITEANGFKNICEIEGSPIWEIDRRDKIYEQQMKEGTYHRP